MKIALSNRTSSELPPADFVRLATDAGADGIVLHSSYGLLDVGPWSDWLTKSRPLAGKPPLAALHCGAIDAGHAASGLARRLRAALEVAVRSGCELILVGGPGGGRPESIARVTGALTREFRAVLGEATSAGVRICLGLGGPVHDTRELWTLRESLDSPAAGIWLDPSVTAESLSVSLKRVARDLELIVLTSPARDGEALRRTIELLRGLAYDRWLLIDAASPVSGSSGDVGAWMNAAVRSVRDELARPVVPLTAYKGDRHAPRFASTRPARKGHL